MIAVYVDTLTLAIMPAQELLEQAVINSIGSYFQTQSTVLCIIYACYLTVTVLLALFFILSKVLRVIL